MDAVSPSVSRKSRCELFEAACQINGGQIKNNSREPAEVGLCETTAKKCTEKTMIKVFSKSKKITEKVIPKLYKKELSAFEKSDTNMLRSVAVYYSGGVMGKRKYRATYRDSSYAKKKL